MHIFNLKSDLISHTTESGTEICISPPPLRRQFFTSKPRDCKQLAGKLQAASVGAVSTQGSRGSAGIVVPLQTPGWRAGQGHSRGSRSRGSPAWAPPVPGARPEQRAAAAAVAGGGGLHGAQREAWRRGLWGGGEKDNVWPKPRRPLEQESRLPASFPRIKTQTVSFPGAQDPGPPAFPSLDPRVLAPSTLFAQTQESGSSTSSYPRSKGPGPQAPLFSGSRSTGVQPIFVRKLVSQASGPPPATPPPQYPDAQDPQPLTSASPQRAISRARASGALLVTPPRPRPPPPHRTGPRQPDWSTLAPHCLGTRPLPKSLAFS